MFLSAACVSQRVTVGSSVDHESFQAPTSSWFAYHWGLNTRKDLKCCWCFKSVMSVLITAPCISRKGRLEELQRLGRELQQCNDAAWFSGHGVEITKCCRRPRKFKTNPCFFLSLQYRWRWQRLGMTAWRRWERSRTRSRFHQQSRLKVRRSPHQINHPRNRAPSTWSPEKVTRPLRKLSKLWVKHEVTSHHSWWWFKTSCLWRNSDIQMVLWSKDLNEAKAAGFIKTLLNP